MSQLVQLTGIARLAAEGESLAEKLRVEYPRFLLANG